MINLTEQAYMLIKEKIINCDYLPGTQLSESKLMEDLNLTRMPVHEALSQLKFEGLVYILPQKGIIISKIQADDINQITEGMILVLSHIIRHYYAWIDKDYIHDLYEQMSKKWTLNHKITDIAETVRSNYNYCNGLYEYLGGIAPNIPLRSFLYVMLEKKYRFLSTMDWKTIALYQYNYWYEPKDTLDVVFFLMEGCVDEAIDCLNVTLRAEGQCLLMAWISVNKTNSKEIRGTN